MIHIVAIFLTAFFPVLSGSHCDVSYAPASGQSEILTYEFDSGKRGIRTSAKIGTGAPTNWEITATTVQDIARVTEEASTAEPIVFTATGNAFGAASVYVAIDGFGQGKAEHTGWQGTGDWSKQLRVPHGSHEMTATAHHRSGQFSPDASHTFSANITQQTITSGYDASGNVTTRTLSGGRVQTLTWDANDRLIRVEERDSNYDGFDWIAVYDGLGRRARTVMTDVKAGAALPNALTTESTFDPEVEFLEIATTINGKRTWKIHGPDLDGRYGGLQGIGGLEATIAEEGSVSTGILSDTFGNAVGTISGTTLTWNPNRVGSYGALPGHAIPTPNETVSVAQATGWRGKTADATGFYNLGARYYEPNGGRFLSSDPMGHLASISLYDYANGDPINFVDPDGRIGKAIGGALGIQQSSSSTITYRAPSYRVVANSFTSSNSISGMSVLSGAFNMIPVLGTVKSYIELSSGNDLFTGARISQSQAAFNVLASALPFTATSIARFGVQSAGRSVATSFASAEARVISRASGTGGSVALRSQRIDPWRTGFGQPSEGLGQLVSQLPKGHAVRNDMALMLREIRASGGGVGRRTNLGNIAGEHITEAGQRWSVFRYNPNTLRAADAIEEIAHWRQIQSGMVGKYSRETLEIMAKQRVLQTSGLSHQLRLEFLNDIRHVRGGNY